jgi:hypothetical protein
MDFSINRISARTLPPAGYVVKFLRCAEGYGQLALVVDTVVDPL